MTDNDPAGAEPETSQPAVEGSAWDIGAPLADRGGHDQHASPPGQDSSDQDSGEA